MCLCRSVTQSAWVCGPEYVCVSNAASVTDWVRVCVSKQARMTPVFLCNLFICSSKNCGFFNVASVQCELECVLLWQGVLGWPTEGTDAQHKRVKKKEKKGSNVDSEGHFQEPEDTWMTCWLTWGTLCLAVWHMGWAEPKPEATSSSSVLTENTRLLTRGYLG